MKISGRVFAVALLFTAVTHVAAADEIIERVVAVAAGDVITQTDVAAAHDLGLMQVSDTGDPSREIISRLIDRALMLAEVDRYAPPEPSAAEIDNGVQAVRARFDTPQAFDAALGKVGMDERALRDTIRQDLRIRAYLDLRFVVAPASDAEGQAAAVARRDALVTAWIAGLRRRATITEVDVTGR
jgi:hypothetical protein